MFLNTNTLFINHLRNQAIVRQRFLLKTNGNQFIKKNLMINNNNNNNYNYCLNGGQNMSRIWDSIKDKLNEKLLIFSGLLGEQFNIYMALRIRRMTQICGLYNRIYSEKTIHKLMSQLIIRMRSRALTLIKRNYNKKSNNSIKYMLSAVCGLFCWDKDRITDKDLNQSIQEFVSLERVSISPQFHDNSSKNCSFSVSAESNAINNNNDNNECNDCQEIDEKPNNEMDTEWEAVIVREDLRVWRKGVKNTSLYQYKVFGTYHDIPARAFFNVQMDTDFRKVWDKLVIELDIVERETIICDKDHNNGEDSGNEVLHWVMRYPFPMNTRDYVYLRRSRIDVNQNVMVLVSKSVEHPLLPETSEHVRVYDYSSQMVIKPHKTFDDYGFDYMLTYFDDPRAAFPSPAYNWMASSGVPDFVEKLHLAAIKLHHYNRNAKQCYNSSQSSQNHNNNNNTTHSSQCIYA